MQVAVRWGEVTGLLHLQTMKIQCKCESCVTGSHADQWISGMEFVEHCGKPISNSWRVNVKVMGCVPPGVMMSSKMTFESFWSYTARRHWGSNVLMISRSQ